MRGLVSSPTKTSGWLGTIRTSPTTVLVSAAIAVSTGSTRSITVTTGDHASVGDVVVFQRDTATGLLTFAQQVKHVAAVNFAFGAMILGEKPQVDMAHIEMGPDNLKTKAEIVPYLKDSFAYARKAIQSLTVQNGGRPIKNPFGPGPDFTPIGMATLLAFHGGDHYGQMVEYLRMNGIVPPASRR